MCVTGLAGCPMLMLMLCALSSHQSPVINPILPLVRSPHLSTARKAGTVRQEIASSFPVPFLSFSTSHSFRFPLLPSLPLPGLLSVIYPLHPPPGWWARSPKTTALFFPAARVSSSSRSSSSSSSQGKTRPNVCNGKTSRRLDTHFSCGPGRLALSKQRPSCPIDLTMRLLLSSAQLCRLVCPIRGWSPRQ